MSTEHSNGWHNKKGAQIMRYRPTIIQILRDTPATGTWIAGDIDAPQHRRHGALMILRQLGAVKIAEREYYTSINNGNKSGRRRNRYRWVADVREQVAATVYSCETFPDCEHKVHIYNPRETDDETLACSECGTEYAKDTVRRLL